MSITDISLAEDYNNRGRIMAGQGRLDEALALYAKAEEEDRLYADTFLNQAEAHILREDFGAAEASLGKALLVNKNNGEALFHLGNVFFMQGRPEQARESFSKALECGFDEGRTCYHLGSLYTEMEDYKNALHYYGRAAGAAPYNPAPRIRKIEVQIALAEYDKALREANALIEACPNTFEGHHYKFVTLMGLERYDEAKLVLENAMGRFSEDLGFVYDKIKYHEHLEEYEAALTLADERFSPDMPEYPDIQKEKAKLLYALHRVDEARALFTKILEDDYDAEMCHALMILLSGYRDLDGVLKRAEQIIEHHNDGGVFDGYYYNAIYYRAMCYREMGEKGRAKIAFDEASKLYRRSCSKFPQHLVLYLYRALCYKELKNIDRAFEMVNFIISVSEDGMAEAYLVRSQLYKETNQEKKAEADRKRAMSMSRTLQEIFISEV